MSVTLILGGARSGKSRHAERLALAASARPIYLATSRAWDADHAARIARHRKDRGERFATLEEEKLIARFELHEAVIVLDCVTLWLTNWFVDNEHDVERSLELAIAELDRALLRNNTWFIVSNELGQGLHAPTEIGRKFTDLQGFTNQALAARADRVVLMVAGIPVEIKAPGKTP